MQTRGSTTWADTDPRGRLRGMQAKGKVGKWIGPTGIVGPMIGRDKGGGRTRPSGQCKR